MEDKKTPVEVLLERGQAFTKTTILLFKLKATEKIAGIMANVVSGFVILILFALLFLNLNIGVALLIGEMLGKIWLGFMILSGFYGLVGLLFYLFLNPWVKRPESDAVIKELLKEEHLSDIN